VERPTARVSEQRDDLIAALAALAPLSLFLLAERRIAGAPGFPLDDSWIHLQFARNLAEGAGFSFNAGTPVAGSTAPLWTLLVAAGFFVAGAAPVVAKAIGVTTTAAAAVLMRRAAIAWGVPRPVALASAIALVWTGALQWGALSGMEVSLAALLVAAALLAHAHDHHVATAALAALATLARPEAVLLVPLLLAAGPLDARRLVTFTLITAAALAPAVAFSMATVGAPIPATAAAKIEGGLVGWLLGVRESAMTTWLWRPSAFFSAWVRWLAVTHWALPLAIAPGIVLAWRRWHRRLGIPAFALLIHPIAMALLAPYRDPAFQEGRYSMHLLPLALLILGLSIASLTGVRQQVVLVGYFAVALAILPRAAEHYGWAVQNINAMQVHLGRWVDKNLPRHARLAVNDIGAIAYFSRREVIDLMGLVTPRVLPYRREGEAGVIEYVRETCPDYVIVFPSWFPALVARREMLTPVYRVRLEHNVVSGGPEMVVYRLERCAV
jgi:arabinofuranosyltransferase